MAHRILSQVRAASSPLLLGLTIATGAGCHLLFEGFSNGTPGSGGAGGTGAMGGATSAGGAGGETGGFGGGGAAGGAGAAGGSGGAVPCTIANNCVANGEVRACEYQGDFTGECETANNGGTGFNADLTEGSSVTVLDVSQFNAVTFVLLLQQDATHLNLALVRWDGAQPTTIARIAADPTNGDTISAKLALHSETRGAIVATSDAPRDSQVFSAIGFGITSVIGFDTTLMSTNEDSFPCPTGECAEVADMIAMPADGPNPFRYIAAVGGDLVVFEPALSGPATTAATIPVSCDSQARIRLGHGGGRLLFAVQSTTGPLISCNAPAPSLYSESMLLCDIPASDLQNWGSSCVTLSDEGRDLSGLQVAYDPAETAFYVGLRTESTVSVNSTFEVGNLTLDDFVLLKTTPAKLEWSTVVRSGASCASSHDARALAFDPVSNQLHFAGRFCDSMAVRVRPMFNYVDIIKPATLAFDEPWIASFDHLTGKTVRAVSYRGAQTTFASPPLLAPPSPGAATGAAFAGSMVSGTDPGTIVAESPYTGYGYLFHLANQ